MKKLLFSLILLILCSNLLLGQTPYPEPEFTKEVYLYRKDSAQPLLRLEKGSSKIDSKVKMAGFGGAESGYTLEGERSTVRLTTGANLSFVFSSGNKEKKSAYMDSIMKANGIDPAAMKGMGLGDDPSSAIVLYKTTAEKGNRRIFLQKSGGMFGSKKNSSSDKYSFSVKKVREGYWELVIDKSLPRGEYAFTMMGMGMGSTDGGVSLFAFAVE